MFTTVIDLPERFQGTVEILKGVKTKVMGIYTYGKHWCGYVEWPLPRIPTPEERLRIIEDYSFSVTFMGPSGDVIQWMTPGYGPNGAGFEPSVEFQNLYWIGFDLPEHFERDAFLQFLMEFVREVMETFRGE